MTTGLNKRKNNFIGKMIIENLESKRYWVSDWLLTSSLNERHVLKMLERDVIEYALNLKEVVIAPRGPDMSEGITCFTLSKNLSPKQIEKYRNPETYRSHNITEPNRYLDRGIYSHKIKGAIFEKL